MPAHLREKLDIRDDDQMIWAALDDQLVATTRRAQSKKAQALFQKFVPTNSPSFSDELIADRRAASEGECADGMCNHARVNGLCLGDRLCLSVALRLTQQSVMQRSGG
jgi:hypothetical protein